VILNQILENESFGNYIFKKNCDLKMLENLLVQIADNEVFLKNIKF
jgi:hypothetical protein